MSRNHHTTLITELLNLLTPEEVNELTTKYSGDKRVSLTALAYNEFFGVPFEEKEKSEEKQEEENKAKILPLHGESSEDLEKKEHPRQAKVTLRVGRECSKLLAKQNPFDSSSITNVAGVAPQLDEEVEVVQEKKGASLFLIEEKSRLEESRKKLREREVIQTYSKVSSIQVNTQKHRQKNAQAAYKKAFFAGVLVNKKHD